METLLRDICKEAKEKQGMTSQDIADRTNIPVSTINNYFSVASKAPSVYNAGAICAVLGVSMDKYFRITHAETNEEQIERMQRQHSTELRAARLEGSMESMQRRIRAQQTLIIILSVVLSIVLLLLALYVILDYQAPDIGLIQGGSSSVVAWVMILLLAVGVGVIAASLLNALRYSKAHSPLDRRG